jgi:hypothetical protein
MGSVVPLRRRGVSLVHSPCLTHCARHVTPEALEDHGRWGLTPVRVRKVLVLTVETDPPV